MRAPSRLQRIQRAAWYALWRAGLLAHRELDPITWTSWWAQRTVPWREWPRRLLAARQAHLAALQRAGRQWDEELTAARADAFERGRREGRREFYELAMSRLERRTGEASDTSPSTCCRHCTAGEGEPHAADCVRAGPRCPACGSWVTRPHAPANPDQLMRCSVCEAETRARFWYPARQGEVGA